MNKLFTMWIDGTKVLWRFFMFQLVVQILFVPLTYFFILLDRGQGPSANSQSPSLLLILILAILMFMIILPLICYAASEILGEFVVERISRKELRAIHQNERS